MADGATTVGFEAGTYHVLLSIRSCSLQQLVAASPCIRIFLPHVF